jgi:hypothetical protein
MVPKGARLAIRRGMQIMMWNAESLSQAQIDEFLKGSEGIQFAGQCRAEVYGRVQQTLVGRQYRKQGKRRVAPRAFEPAVVG